MAQGRKGTRGERLRLSTTVPVGVDLKTSELVTPLSRGEGRGLDRDDVKIRVYLAGLADLYTCPACISGAVPCALHSVEASLARLKLEAPKEEPRADIDGENRRLSDLWISHWLRLYGTPAERSAGKFVRCPLGDGHFAALALARKKHGFEAIRDAINGIFSDEWYTKKARPSLYAVLREPAKFAAYLVSRGAGASGTLQREPGWADPGAT